MNKIKIIKITSLACTSCIIMNNIFNKIKTEYDIEYDELDYDYDDIEKYNVGKILPVFIIYKDNNEITRICGEHSLDDFKNTLEEVIK